MRIPRLRALGDTKAGEALRGYSSPMPATRVDAYLSEFFGGVLIAMGLFALFAFLLGALGVLPMSSRPVSLPGWISFWLGASIVAVPLGGFGVWLVVVGAMAVRGLTYPIARRPGRRRPTRATDHTDWRGHPLFREAEASIGRSASPSTLAPMESKWANLRKGLAWAVLWYGFAGGVLWLGASSQPLDAHSFGAVVASCILMLLGARHLLRLAKHSLSMLMVGKTWVEVGPAMPAPGEGVHLTLHQKGKLRIKKAELALECVEVSTTLGIDNEAAREHFHVFQQVLATRENFRSDGSRPLLEGEVRLPADAMHSFRAGSNEIIWLVRATLEIAGRPNVNEIFPLAVRPEVVAG